MRFPGVVLGLVLCACGDNVAAVGAIDAATGDSGSGGQVSAPGDSGGTPDGGSSGATGVAGSEAGGATADDGGTEQALDAGAGCLGCGPDSGPNIHDAGVDASTDAQPEDPCQNGIKDGEETDIDCGFGCSPCDDFMHCLGPANCKSGKCKQVLVDSMYQYICDEPSCDDGLSNGDETGGDCGGLVCEARCSISQPCVGDYDCASDYCDLESPPLPNGMGQCRLATCRNGMLDEWETEIDCGGQYCKVCGP